MFSYRSCFLGLFLFCLLVSSQVTSVWAQQDCFDAIYLCSTSYTENSSFLGVGNEQEVSPGSTCLGNGEVNSVWYRFTVNTGGTLQFQLNPLNANDDYDFALFDLTNDSCSGILAGLNSPASCNYSSQPGSTGLSQSGSGNNNGSSGPNQNAQLNVQAGDQYALMISNFTASQNGYTIDFGGTAVIADNQPAMPDSVSFGGVCNPRQIVLFFTEEFDCASISGLSEITVTGPSTPTITQVSGLGCNDGLTDQLRIRFQNKIMVTGTYTITINTGTDGNTFTDGCGNQTPSGTTFTFDVEFIGPDVSVINVVHTNCGLDQGSAEAVVTNGTGPFSYNWNSSPQQTTPIASDLGPGTYRIRVIDANGCQDRVNVTIENNSPFDLTNTAVTPVTCNGLSDGTAQLIPTGGQAPYTISWSSNPVQTGQLATGLPAGQITATVTDNTGCTEDVTLNVNQPSAMVIDVASVRPDCGFANGTLTATVTGGAGGYAYSWDTAPVQTSAALNNISTGIYTLTVTDQSGCSATETTILTNNFAPTADITDRIPDCGQGTGSVTVIPTSGVAPYAFSWNTSPIQTSATATGLSTGDYFVTITDANSCVQILNVKIDSIAAPALDVVSTQPTCGNSDGSLLANVSNGTEPFLFAWSSSANTTDLETGLPEGTYTVSVTDAIGCTDMTTVDLMQLPPETEIEQTDVCIGEESSFSFVTNSGASSWLWDFGDGTTSTDQMATHTYSTFGDFVVTLTLDGGCMPHQVSDTASVFEPPTASFFIDPEIPTTRTEVSFIYNGSGGTEFLWNLGDGEWSQEVRPSHLYPEDGSYDVFLTVTDANGCQDTVTQTIEILLQPVIYLPNAFMPGGTPANSMFKGYGIGITSAELSIFDRWGTLLYYSSDVNEITTTGWDGSYHGKPAPQSVYPYKIKATFYNNTAFEKLGTVTLVR
ncbi:MAG: hypothetical protein RL266_1378 [Bacteroidota bacterium]